jgi:hypothetical protein
MFSEPDEDRGRREARRGASFESLTATLKRAAREPEAVVAAVFALSIAVGFTWGLPGPDTWAVDSISPRSCGLGAIVETYTPGHWHHYPPLHMAILTVVSLPWMAAAAHRVGLSAAALGPELLKPFYMTGIEVCSRLVTAAMALAVALNTMRLWARIGGRRVGLAAGAVVASNASLVYYAHTGDLEVPYLFWITWGLVELDRVAGGERRERQAMLLATASVLTKDQAAAAWVLLLPIYAFAVPRLAYRAPGEKSASRRAVVTAALLSGVVYAVVSGAATNPVGFAHRVRIDLLGAAESWAGYSRNVGGRLALARDIVLRTPLFTSWPIAAAAGIGLGVALTRTGALARARAAMPFVAALSFTIFFNFGARRSEERFLLPQSLFFFPYAALALDRALAAWPRARVLLLTTAGLALMPAAVGVASMDATLLADSRYEAERFLDTLPAGTHVEVYGSANFLPRIPPRLVAVRAGVEALAARQPISGIVDVVDEAMDPRPRAPEVIVLGTELSRVSATEPHGPAPFGATDYVDDLSPRLFRGLYDGSLGYEMALQATCALPYPLQCRKVWGSAGGEVWIYRSSSVTSR